MVTAGFGSEAWKGREGCITALHCMESIQECAVMLSHVVTWFLFLSLGVFKIKTGRKAGRMSRVEWQTVSCHWLHPLPSSFLSPF